MRTLIAVMLAVLVLAGCILNGCGGSADSIKAADEAYRQYNEENGRGQ